MKNSIGRIAFDKKISVTIPTLNEEDFVTSVLDSLNKQTFNHRMFEVIMVDNGSIDQTVVKIKEYIKNGSALDISIVSERERGISVARNKGASKAKGDILVFLDADNIAAPNLLKEIYSQATQNKYEAGSIRTLPVEKTAINLLIFRGIEAIKVILNRPSGKNYCFKTVFAAVGGYNETISIGTNNEFLIRVKRLLASQGKKLVLIKEPVFASDRRFKKCGYVNTLLKWLLAYLGIRNIKYPPVGLVLKQKA